MLLTSYTIDSGNISFTFQGFKGNLEELRREAPSMEVDGDTITIPLDQIPPHLRVAF